MRLKNQPSQWLIFCFTLSAMRYCSNGEMRWRGACLYGSTPPYLLVNRQPVARQGGVAGSCAGELAAIDLAMRKVDRNRPRRPGRIRRVNGWHDHSPSILIAILHTANIAPDQLIVADTPVKRLRAAGRTELAGERDGSDLPTIRNTSGRRNCTIRHLPTTTNHSQNAYPKTPVE